jgi:GDP-4-dehydro-6-deoxy-D-mannose reductase
VKRVLLTGSGGFLGQRASELLRSRGVEVHELGRATHQGADLATPEPWEKELKSHDFDAIWHLAGTMTAPDIPTFYKVNVGFAAALFEAARRVGFPKERPILLVGSAAEIGNAPEPDRPIDEDAPLRPVNHYGASKAAQTELGLLEARTRAVVIARAYNLMGPGMPDSLAFGHFAKAIAAVKRQGGKGTISVGNLAAVRDFTDTRDAARLFLALLENPRAYGAVTNIATGTGVRMEDALALMIRVSGAQIEVRLDPTRLKPADVPFSIGSTTRLTALAGPLQFLSLEQSLRDMLEAAEGG